MNLEAIRGNAAISWNFSVGSNGKEKDCLKKQNKTKQNKTKTKQKNPQKTGRWVIPVKNQNYALQHVKHPLKIHLK